jgi:hypothetical protein
VIASGQCATKVETVSYPSTKKNVVPLKTDFQCCTFPKSKARKKTRCHPSKSPRRVTSKLPGVCPPSSPRAARCKSHINEIMVLEFRVWGFGFRLGIQTHRERENSHKSHHNQNGSLHTNTKHLLRSVPILSERESEREREREREKDRERQRESLEWSIYKHTRSCWYVYYIEREREREIERECVCERETERGRRERVCVEYTYTHSLS